VGKNRGWRDWAYSRKDGILADMLVAEAIAYEGKTIESTGGRSDAEADGPPTTNALICT